MGEGRERRERGGERKGSKEGRKKGRGVGGRKGGKGEGDLWGEFVKFVFGHSCLIPLIQLSFYSNQRFQCAHRNQGDSPFLTPERQGPVCSYMLVNV